MKETKLKFLLDEKYLGERGTVEEEQVPEYTAEEKKQFLEAISNFNKYSENVYRNYDLKEMTTSVRTISEMAANMMKKSSQMDEEWFDGITMNRHVKMLKENIKIFERTAREITELQHRLENSYEEVGSVLNKYYEIKSGE